MKLDTVESFKQNNEGEFIEMQKRNIEAENQYLLMEVFAPLLNRRLFVLGDLPKVTSRVFNDLSLLVLVEAWMALVYFANPSEEGLDIMKIFLITVALPLARISIFLEKVVKVHMDIRWVRREMQNNHKALAKLKSLNNLSKELIDE